MLNKILKLLNLEAASPVDLKPGLNALGFGKIHLRVRVYRAAEGRWYDVEEIKP